MKKLNNLSTVILLALVGLVALMDCQVAKPTSSKAPSTALSLKAERRSTPDAKTANMQLARQVLNKYLALLHHSNYNEAVDYYGGSYEALEHWNPSIRKSDRAVLFKNGCEINGLQCLKVRRIVQEKQVSATEFKFLVEFSTADGKLFSRVHSLESLKVLSNRSSSIPLRKLESAF